MIEAASDPVSRVPVLEVGGTHAAACWVDTASWRVLAEPSGRVPLPADGSADRILDDLARCVLALGSVAGRVLAVAIPGPFDYAAGIGRFRDVGKFDALAGVQVGTELAARLRGRPSRIAFVNDAAAFGLGEWLAGAARGTDRAVAITLGTGIGSAFLADGAVVANGPDVPPNGHVHLLSVGSRPLESVVSRRAILTRYRAAGGDPSLDVAAVAARALAGETVAQDAFVEPLRVLGATLAPWLRRFRAQLLVVGGAISGSWELVEPALRSGLAAEGAPRLPVVAARQPDAATALGAAWHAVGLEHASVVPTRRDGTG